MLERSTGVAVHYCQIRARLAASTSITKQLSSTTTLGPVAVAVQKFYQKLLITTVPLVVAE